MHFKDCALVSLQGSASTCGLQVSRRVKSSWEGDSLCNAIKISPNSPFPSSLCFLFSPSFMHDFPMLSNYS